MGGDTLHDVEDYMNLPYELSGSMAKNRFRNELLWGIKKMLDIYEEEDFTVIFDYKCDIEVHLTDRYEFYQVKTHRGKNMTVAEMLKRTNGRSILGKLFELRGNGTSIVQLAVVSNCYLSLNRNPIVDCEEIRFSDRGEKDIEKINQQLQKELGLDHVDLNNLIYVFTSMNLNDPQDDITGHIVRRFEMIKGCEPQNPNALYRLIFDTVSSKACFEQKLDSYGEIVRCKGMTKAELDKMLEAHRKESDDSVEKTRQYIEAQEVRYQRKMNRALGRLLRDISRSKELQKKELEIAGYLIEHEEEFSTDQDCLDELFQHFSSSFSEEFDQTEIHVFCVMILYRFKAGKYDEEIGI